MFLYAGYQIAIKVTNNSIYLFGIRHDAVLTDSMSYKNEDPKVQEFLKGHDDQLYVGDLVYSNKVNMDTKLKVYDIVIFKHHDTGRQTIHRIVQILPGSMYIDKEDRFVIRADTANEASDDGAYKKSEIIAKMKARVPFLGHIESFFSSVYGLILIIGLMVIMVAYQFISANYVDKKPKETEDASSAPPENENNINNKDIIDLPVEDANKDESKK